tara:strand:+ start:5929 stop:6408 length:480 start_codon:yes stop_codon:yes gene_type:complete
MNVTPHGHDGTKTPGDFKMSIESIGGAANAYAVQRPSASPEMQKEPEKVNTPQNTNNYAISSYVQNSSHHVGACNHSYGSEMSTEDFISLKNQTEEQPFAALDKAIERMKENMEAVGDVLETLSEMAQKTSKQTLGLQILMETFDAIDELNSNDMGKRQ